MATTNNRAESIEIEENTLQIYHTHLISAGLKSRRKSAGFLLEIGAVVLAVVLPFEILVHTANRSFLISSVFRLLEILREM